MQRNLKVSSEAAKDIKKKGLEFSTKHTSICNLISENSICQIFGDSGVTWLFISVYPFSIKCCRPSHGSCTDALGHHVITSDQP